MVHHWHAQGAHGDHYCQLSFSEEDTMANSKLKPFHCQQSIEAWHQQRAAFLFTETVQGGVNVGINGHITDLWKCIFR